MVIQTGFNWLIEQQLLLSILFCGFILLERFGLKALGSRFVYKLAWLLPAALVIANLPNAIKPLQNSDISHYLITPNQPFTNEVGISWALMYALITAGLLIASFITHTRFVKSLQLTELTQFEGTLTAGVKTYISQYVATPMVVGILNSKLVLPSNYNAQFDKATLALILEHENVHIKRKDNLTNAFMLLPTILLWFNPLAWFCYASMRRLQELTCDERVLADKNIQQHILYSKALISCAANAPAGFMAYSHYGDKKTMLQRLTNIKHSTERSKFAKGGLLLVAASMLSGLAIAKQPEAMAKEDHISPTMRIEPLYPIQAAQQGISGSVVLKYDITPNGETANVSVVSAKPEAIFDREAKKALRQWQYKASSMGYQNVLVQLDFAINNEVANTDLIERIKVSH